MKPLRFLRPNAIGFTLRTTRQALVDKLKGAPPRTVQAANYVEKHAQQGNARDVLDTIDRFAREERWLMNVGPEKGPLMQELAGRLIRRPGRYSRGARRLPCTRGTCGTSCGWRIA